MKKVILKTTSAILVRGQKSLFSKNNCFQNFYVSEKMRLMNSFLLKLSEKNKTFICVDLNIFFYVFDVNLHQLQYY